jgi:cellobiose phosphorylase
MMIKPGEACANLQKLSERGFEGRYGFYEAIDFTPNRLLHEQSEVLIRSFMAHHQGMSFISLVNYFTNNLMIKRFSSDPLIQTAVLLLQERVPKASPFQMLPSVLLRTRDLPEKQGDALRVFHTAGTPFPEVHLLSNGRYHVMVTNAGGGYSRWRDIAVTRWSEDATRDNFGTFIYINDISSDSRWSATFQPTLAEPKNYEAIFPQARAEFRRRDQGLDTYTEIAVSPEDDIEHRRISLSNFTVKTRTIELTSYAEVVLIKPDEDAAHPAFANLFMQTEIIREHKAVLCSRRPRSPQEKPPWMFHLLAVDANEQFEVSYETDRLKFIGRGRTLENPSALEEAGPLSGTAGSVLDPIVSIRCGLTLKPGDTVTVGFISGMAQTRLEAMTLIEKYQDRRLADRVFDMAQIHGRVLLQQLNAAESDAQVYGRLASSILYASPFRRANPALLLKNRRGQSGLWAYSISGDLPIVLLRISDQAKIELAAKMIQAHTYWHLKGLQVDLVIWNEDWSGYRQVLNELITGLISAGPEASSYDKPGGIFLRHPDQMSEEDRILMQSSARVIITDSGGILAEQIQRYAYGGINIPKLTAARDKRPFGEIENFRQDNLLFFNGWGGFTRDGREYIIQIKPGNSTPMPWVNILANKNFGSVVLQSGGYSWYENSRNFRLTPWYNDPVSESSGEALYIRDEATGSFWSPLPLPAPGSSDYLARHGFGYSVFEYSLYDLKSELWIYVDINAPVKFWMLKVRNDSPSARRLTATIFLELVLGDLRSKNQMHIRTEIDSRTGALFATNPYNAEFAGRVMFLGANDANRSITGDRSEFIGRNGTLADPLALHKVRLSGRVGAGLDPAAALQVSIELEPGQEKDIVFILGVGRDSEDAQNLVQRYNGSLPAYQAREKVWEYWKHTLGTINIETPDQAINLITNGWLVYQIMVSRLWARSGFYQSGGAFGFRDQLQDVMALIHAEPGLVREHLLLCASRQFGEGDVQHWWHPPQGRGVRTRISDDFLWMPLAAGEYIARTGDTGVLDESVPFLEGRSLNNGEDSYYDLPVRSEENASFYEHCKRAVMNAFRFGPHGLPFMGGGDWNDGMNLVGASGRGESVWLAFFLYHILEEFGPLARMRGDESFAEQCAQEAGRLKDNIETHAWDGKWYRRAYFDDGTPLGSMQNQDCQIDAVAQSWAILSGAGSHKRARQAMQSLEHRLIRPKSGLILLLDPPFDKSDQEPGYIKGYVPGIRENGGQYTHAAIWAVMAFAGLGNGEKVKKLLSMINPINHGSTGKKIGVYKVEPYVMSADIYGIDPHVGRGGWTWYTGSAAWMYRLIIESVLGLDLKVNKLSFKPCLPEDWEYFKVHYRFRETVYHLDFHQIKPGCDIHVFVDGVEQPDKSIPLIDDRLEHFAEIVIGA